MSKHLHISREGSTEYEYWNRVDLLEEEEPEPTTGLRVDGNQLRDENQQVLLNGVVHPYASTGLDKYVGWLQGIQKGYDMTEQEHAVTRALEPATVLTAPADECLCG